MECYAPVHLVLLPPPSAQVRDLISEGNSGQFTARGGQIDFEFFCQLMRKKARDEDTEAELKDAFRVLDKVGQGWIGVDEMRRICKVRARSHITVCHPARSALFSLCVCPRQLLGEDLTEDEVKDMISEAISNFEGRIYYDGFVKTMISKV